MGRSLALFVPEGQRRDFRATVAQLRQADKVREWELRMQAWQGSPFDARLTVGVVRSETGRPNALHWLVQDISERKQPEVAPHEGGAWLEQEAAYSRMKTGHT